MRKFWITFEISGRWQEQVEAPNFGQALEQAEERAKEHNKASWNPLDTTVVKVEEE